MQDETASPADASYPDMYLAKQALAGRISKESTRERLVRQKAGMLKRIAEMDKIINLLDKNPDTEELLDLLGNLGREY